MEEEDDIYGDGDNSNPIPSEIIIPQLSEGSILKIRHGSKFEKDLMFQVLGFVWLPNREQYRLDLSDGKFRISSAILEKSSTHLIQQKILEEFCIINVKR